MPEQTNYIAPTVSSIVSNLTPSTNLSNIAKGVWLTEQVTVALSSDEKNCTSTFFTAINDAIECLPKGAEKITHTLPSGKVVKGERNARQSAKKSITTAYKNFIKSLDDNSDLYKKYSGKNLTFKQSQPMFKAKAAPKTYEDKLLDMLKECMSEDSAWTVLLATLETHGQRYWARKRDQFASNQTNKADMVNESYQEFLLMGMSESTALLAIADKFDAEAVEMVASE